MIEMTRAERWYWVQTLPPLTQKSFFEKSYEEFLKALPNYPLGAAELARLAYYAGATAAFHGLADHDSASRAMSEAEAQTAMSELALEPIEYLHRYNIGFD